MNETGTRHWYRRLVVVMLLLTTHGASAQGQRSITDTSVTWPTLAELMQVLLLRDYNTRVVVIGITLLGVAAGIIGTFMLLRKRSLMGDAVSHATLPGIAIAFIIMVQLGQQDGVVEALSGFLTEPMVRQFQNGKFLPGLLAGATLSGLLGMGVIQLIRGTTRLKEDAALGIILSVFFGLGISIMGLIQKMHLGHQAGLESFIYGKTASMLAMDAWLVGGVALLVALVCMLLVKEFCLLCFDQHYAAAQGWPTGWLDLVMMFLVVVVTVIGLQAVGLILVIALLIIPAAAARFWTNHLLRMVVAAALIGGFSGMLGAGISALVPRLPAGAIIVLVAAAVFAFSMVFGPARGLLTRYLDHHRLAKSVGRQNLLRAMYEINEQADADGPRGVSLADLMQQRSWSTSELAKLLRRAQGEGIIYADSAASYRFTENGQSEARRIVRNHRLWEIYLITHADIAPSRVDRDADQIEHVLGQVMVDKLEALLAEEHPNLAIPPSPHPLTQTTTEHVWN